jgi:hypothetical protein
VTFFRSDEAEDRIRAAMEALNIGEVPWIWA